MRVLAGKYELPQLWQLMLSWGNYNSFNYLLRRNGRKNLDSYNLCLLLYNYQCIVKMQEEYLNYNLSNSGFRLYHNEAFHLLRSLLNEICMAWR